MPSNSKLVFYEGQAQELEKQELEMPTGTDLVELHSQLLCIYLCNFDLCNAKFLWKRIPAQEKTVHPILAQIWEVGKKLWLKERNAVFALIRATQWPATIQPYMACLEDVYRQKSLQLIGKAYLSIQAASFAELVGYSDQPEEVEKLLERLQREQGWTCDVAARLIMPKRPAAPNVPLMRNEEQLQSLTSFVSFLEN
uniref:EOG090X0F3A n=1 Tax=Alona affinis TaxID=381656 RepID=A0A9N6WSD8_9CRUS|nr:EOG090X0F3A [Alona affinis]